MGYLQKDVKNILFPEKLPKTPTLINYCFVKVLFLPLFFFDFFEDKTFQKRKNKLQLFSRKNYWMWSSQMQNWDRTLWLSVPNVRKVKFNTTRSIRFHDDKTLLFITRIEWKWYLDRLLHKDITASKILWSVS